MNKLKEKRLEANLRMVDLARIANVSLATIWNIEQGMGPRSRKKTRMKILNALNKTGLIVEENDIFAE